MTRYVDLTGQRFGRLTVLEYAGLSGSGNSRWSVRCDCGTVFETGGHCLRHGQTRNCGCLRAEHARSVAHLAFGASRVPVAVTAPDGIRHLFTSVTEAAAWLGCAPSTVSIHLRNEKPYKNFILEKQ